MGELGRDGRGKRQQVRNNDIPLGVKMGNVINTVGWLNKPFFLACLYYNTIKVKNFFTHALLKLPLQKAMNHKQESASFFWE